MVADWESVGVGSAVNFAKPKSMILTWPSVVKDVGWLNIAMNDPFRMCGLQTGGGLHRNFDGIRRCQRMASDPFLKSLAFQEFHGNIANPVLLAEVMNGANVRVVERADCPRFAFKTLSEACQRRLDCDIPTEPAIAGFVHFAHTARANSREDLIGAELVTLRKGHIADS